MMRFPPPLQGFLFQGPGRVPEITALDLVLEAAGSLPVMEVVTRLLPDLLPAELSPHTRVHAAVGHELRLPLRLKQWGRFT